MTEKAKAIERILTRVEGVFRELLPVAHQELLDLDLTTPQLKVVLLLYLNGPARMSSLAGSLGVTLATATGIIDRLVEKDFVVRENNKDDRRVVTCTLSAKGHKLTDRLYISARERARQLLEGLQPSQIKLIDDAIKSLPTDKMLERTHK
jgi:DNA-binding MarR family transcriptional regulator